jgi:hypothetical protein
MQFFRQGSVLESTSSETIVKMSFKLKMVLSFIHFGKSPLNQGNGAISKLAAFSVLHFKLLI